MDIKTEIEFSESARMTDVYTESSSEQVLPDYNGDVRKILYTCAEARPAGKFASADEVEFSGIVVYDVIYLDSENRISSTSFSSEYDYKVKCQGEKYQDAYADTRVANYTVRLNGPRKVAAKSTVVGSVKLCENSSVSIEGDGFDEKYLPEVERKTVGIKRCILASPIEREYAESVERLDGAIADEVSVIFCGAEAFADSVSLSSGGAEISGKLRMRAVVKNEDSPAYLAEKTVNFEECVTFDEVAGDMKLLPDLRVVSTKATVTPEEGGCAIVMSVILELSVVSEGNESVEVITDGYSKSCKTNISYSDFGYLELSDIVSSRCAHSAEVARSELEGEGLREIVFLSAQPKVEGVEKRADSIKLFGEVRYSGVASELLSGDKVSYVPLKLSAPFEIELPHSASSIDTLRLETRVRAHSATASIDINKIYAGCTLDAECVLYNEKNERIVSAVFADTENKYENTGSKVTVYYPSSDETLFEIAKRYHTSPLKLAEDNTLDTSTVADTSTPLLGVKRLLIYR